MDEREMETFIAYVRTMRKAQKIYFKTHDYNALVESRTFEAKVDNMIQKHDEKKAYGNQGGLFDSSLPF